jgi:hypothetical protein
MEPVMRVSAKPLKKLPKFTALAAELQASTQTLPRAFVGQLPNKNVHAAAGPAGAKQQAGQRPPDPLPEEAAD